MLICSVGGREEWHANGWDELEVVHKVVGPGPSEKTGIALRTIAAHADASQLRPPIPSFFRRTQNADKAWPPPIAPAY